MKKNKIVSAALLAVALLSNVGVYAQEPAMINDQIDNGNVVRIYSVDSAKKLQATQIANKLPYTNTEKAIVAARVVANSAGTFIPGFAAWKLSKDRSGSAARNTAAAVAGSAFGFAATKKIVQEYMPTTFAEFVEQEEKKLAGTFGTQNSESFVQALCSDNYLNIKVPTISELNEFQQSNHYETYNLVRENERDCVTIRPFFNPNASVDGKYTINTINNTAYSRLMNAPFHFTQTINNDDFAKYLRNVAPVEILYNNLFVHYLSKIVLPLNGRANPTQIEEDPLYKLVKQDLSTLQYLYAMGLCQAHKRIQDSYTQTLSDALEYSNSKSVQDMINDGSISSHIIDGWDDKNVLDLSSCNLTSLKGLENLPNKESFIAIDLQSNFLKNIDARIFSGFKNVQKILLRSNKLSDIEEYAFADNLKLQTIDLSDNLFERVSLSIFYSFEDEQLPNLINIYLINNPLDSITLALPNILGCTVHTKI